MENIRELFESKEKLDNKIVILESKRSALSHIIEKRWKALIGFGCGYFNDWNLIRQPADTWKEGVAGDVVTVVYNNRCGDENEDRIPIRFFEIDCVEEAKEAYKEYTDEIRSKRMNEEIRKKVQKAKEVLKKYPGEIS